MPYNIYRQPYILSAYRSADAWSINNAALSHEKTAAPAAALFILSSQKSEEWLQSWQRNKSYLFVVYIFFVGGEDSIGAT